MLTTAQIQDIRFLRNHKGWSLRKVAKGVSRGCQGDGVYDSYLKSKVSVTPSP